MTKTILTIRHLPTDWNLKGWLQGRCDRDIVTPSDLHCQQINRNRQILDKVNVANIDVFASPLKRTHQTATAYRCTSWQISDDLLELDFGRYEGKPKSAMVAELGNKWVENPRSVVLGEGIVELEARIVRFIKSIPDGKTVIVFGHGSWIRGLLSIAEHGDVRDLNRVQIDPNDLNEVKLASVSS